jgi:hypothetical protein
MAWSYRPSGPCHDDDPGLLTIRRCPWESGPVVLLAILNGGYTAHVPQEQAPQMVWEILSAASDNPYELLRKVIGIAVDHARET